MDDEAKIAAIKSEVLTGGYRLLGPHKPGTSEDGWFAPIVPMGSQAGAAPYGWGKTPLEAAQAALDVWRKQIATRPSAS